MPSPLSSSSSSSLLSFSASAFVWLSLFAALANGCAGLLNLQNVTYADALPNDDGGSDARQQQEQPCPSDAESCQSFETNVVDPWRLDDNDGGTVVRVDGTQTHTGHSALDVATTVSAGQNSGAAIYRLSHPAIEGSRIVVRAWVFAASELANASIIELRHNDRSVSGGVSLKLAGPSLVYNVTDKALMRHDFGTARGLTIGTWQCVRLLVDVSETAGHVTVLLDQDTLIDSAANTLVGESSWESLWMGLPFVDAPADSIHLFVDDVVVAHQMIECE